MAKSVGMPESARTLKYRRDCMVNFEFPGGFRTRERHVVINSVIRREMDSMYRGRGLFSYFSTSDTAIWHFISFVNIPWGRDSPDVEGTVPFEGWRVPKYINDEFFRTAQRGIKTWTITWVQLSPKELWITLNFIFVWGPFFIKKMEVHDVGQHAIK